MRYAILAKVEFSQAFQAAQILELAYAIILERELLKRNAPLEPLKPCERVVAERGTPQVDELIEPLQLVQMLVVQLELLHVPPPPIGAAITIGAVGRACC